MAESVRKLTSIHRGVTGIGGVGNKNVTSKRVGQYQYEAADDISCQLRRQPQKKWHLDFTSSTSNRMARHVFPADDNRCQIRRQLQTGTNHRTATTNCPEHVQFELQAIAGGDEICACSLYMICGLQCVYLLYLFIYLFSIPEIHQSGYRTCHCWLVHLSCGHRPSCVA
jgi:hypothetical protein